MPTKGKTYNPVTRDDFDFISKLIDSGVNKVQVSSITGRSQSVIGRVDSSGGSWEGYRAELRKVAAHQAEYALRKKAEAEIKKMIEESAKEPETTVPEEKADEAAQTDTREEELAGVFAHYDGEGNIVLLDIPGGQTFYPAGSVPVSMSSAEDFQATALRRLDILKDNTEFIMACLGEIEKSGVKVRLFFNRKEK